jgi:hypothetical protein
MREGAEHKLVAPRAPGGGKCVPRIRSGLGWPKSRDELTQGLDFRDPWTEDTLNLVFIRPPPEFCRWWANQIAITMRVRQARARAGRVGGGGPRPARRAARHTWGSGLWGPLSSRRAGAPTGSPRGGEAHHPVYFRGNSL